MTRTGRHFLPPWSVEDTNSKAAEGVTTTALPFHHTCRVSRDGIVRVSNWG